MLRAIAAGLFVFVGVMGSVAIIGASGRLEGDERWPAALIVCAGAGLTIAAMYLFNPRGERWLVRGPSLAELERQGLVVDTDFRVTRAFGVREFEDEGPHYFLELADGAGILVLTGQYLYDYEPSDDDPDLDQSRRFPCTAFTVRRHRTGTYVLDLVVRGDVVEPEVMAPGRVISQWFRDGFTPADGDILTGVTFDELKALRAQT